MENPSQKNVLKKAQQQSTQFWTVLRKHLALFSEHYRQPITELSVIAYAEDLQSLSPEELDRACVEARRSSEFMPVSATILSASRKPRGNEILLSGPRQLAYPEVTQEEREDALKFSAALRDALKITTPVKATSEKVAKRSPVLFRESRQGLTIEEQKEILRKKGYL